MAIIFPILSTFDPRGVNSAQKAFKGLGGVSKTATVAFAALGAATVKFGTDAVKAASADQLAQLKLAKTLENVTKSTAAQTAAVEKFITAQQFATGVSDTQLRPALETLVRATGDVTKAQGLLKVGLDVSAGSGRDLESISLALAKAQGGQFTALQRLGIVIPETIKKSKDFAKVQEYLNSLFGGQAAVAADTFEGKLRILRERLGEAQETIGAKLIPVLTNLVDAFLNNVMPAIERVVNGGFRALLKEIANLSSGMTGMANVIKQVILAFVSMKIAAVALALAPPIIAGITASLTTLRIATLYGAAGFKVLGVAIRGALASTGIGLLVVGLGLVIGKLIEMRLEAGSTDETVRFMESNGTTAFRNMGQAAFEANKKIAGNIITLNAVALAASRASDAQENAGIKDVKRGRTPPIPVAVPEVFDGLTGAAEKATKATVAVKGLSAAGKIARDVMANLASQLGFAKVKLEKLEDQLKTANEVLTTARDKFNEFKSSVKNAITGILNFGTAQDKSASSAKDAQDAQTALIKAQKDYDATLKTDNIEAQQRALEDLQAAQTAATDSITNKKSFIQVLQDQATLASTFAGKVQTLISMGLSETAISQVLSAGADAGSKIADEIIAGGATVVDQVNTLVSATASVATQVGDLAATEFYSAGVIAGEALVDGVKNAIANATSMFDALKASAAAAGFTIDESGNLVNTGAQKQVADKLREFKGKKSQSGTKLSKQEKQSIIDLANSLGVEIPQMAKGGIVNKPTLALIGEAGPEAVVPLSGRNAGMGNTINLTVNAGMGADGASIGREIVDAIKRYERVSGPVFAGA